MRRIPATPKPWPHWIGFASITAALIVLAPLMAFLLHTPETPAASPRPAAPPPAAAATQPVNMACGHRSASPASPRVHLAVDASPLADAHALTRLAQATTC